MNNSIKIENSPIKIYSKIYSTIVTNPDNVTDAEKLAILWQWYKEQV